MTLDEMADSIETAKDLGRFVEALAADLVENPETWENASLLDFLDALADYARSTDQIYTNVKDLIRTLPLADQDERNWKIERLKPPLQPSWWIFAEALLAAKITE